MRESRFVKVGLIVVMILLTVDIGSRILFSPSEAKAAGKVQYKLVSLKQLNSDAEVEQLLNNMADQGWEFDTVVEMAQVMIFKK